jgi:hypothetical protein
MTRPLLATPVVLLLRMEQPGKQCLALGVACPAVNTPREATHPNNLCRDHWKTVTAPTLHPLAYPKRLRQ